MRNWVSSRNIYGKNTLKNTRMNQNVHVWDVIRALDLSGGHGGMGGGRLGLIDFRVPHGQLRTNG